jgi:hypothetical protein
LATRCEAVRSSSFDTMYNIGYEIATWVFGVVSLVSLLGVAGLVMYLSLHRSADLLQDRLYEDKRAWARKWLARAAWLLLIAVGLLMLDGVLGSASKGR